MFGYFIVTELTGKKDSAGYFVQAKVKAQMNENILGVLYLPPYLRQAQSQIDVDATIIGILDETTGLGCAIVGMDDADFGYFYNADIEIQKTLNVKEKITTDDAIEAKNDIKSTSGDVVAATISLKTHTHAITAATFTGTIDPSTGAATGTISGNTEVPA